MAIKAPFANPNLWLGCVWFSVKFELDLENLFETFDCTAHSHKKETYQMETIPYMETFLIYQTVY